MPTPEKLRIEYNNIDVLKRWPKNPKNHDTPEIIASFERFGFVAPIIIDETSGRIVAGHGRLEATQRMKTDGKDAPARVQTEPDGLGGEEWYIPTLRGIGFKNEAEAEAYLLADNFLTEKGGWITEDLIEALQRLQVVGFEGTGFNAAELKRLIAKNTGKMPIPGEDDTVEKPAKPKTKRGYLYEMGHHRILCGNATHAADVKKLLAGTLPGMMVTDPPYGVNYDPAWRVGARNDNKRTKKLGKVANDDKADWREAWRLFAGPIAYVWHSGLHAAEVQQSLESCGFEIRSQIIWAKDRFAISRGNYHWQHEPCWFAVRKDSTANWQGARDQATLWNKDQPSIGDRLREARQTENWTEAAQIAEELDQMLQGTIWTIATREDSGYGHGSQKPVECMRRPMVNHSQPGDTVYDPFIGSGTTLIAAESTNRVCYGIDIDPGYVDVVVERYEKLTGGKAKLVKK